ncbi:type II toxin-antitoxin system death-on-curing family toxin [Nocardioides rubriscoriae]|uniref:type II toxin-antitoxin system death-on-curing family toxin n=1 Tax=Nocardioides rubriscoriae TaxID=642762 RepID=UPI001FE25E57|nr:type II toxin-antitoxin system death-on-curing family toxin [Nocardioides rubriscoriae]
MLAVIESEMGPVHVIRDPGLLAAAIARPQATIFGEEACPGLAGKAAALMHSIVSSHPLVDGDKRLGLKAAMLFLGLNGRRLDASDDDIYDLVIAVAAGQITEVQDISDRLRAWGAPLRDGDRL